LGQTLYSLTNKILKITPNLSNLSVVCFIFSSKFALSIQE